MPWSPDDAKGHTHHADTDKKKRMWAHVANSALNGGHSEASAIRQANAAVHKMDIDRDEIMGRIADWLSKNAPEILDMAKKQDEPSLWVEGKDGHYYLKDMTAGDAHVTTALGNEDKKKKKPKISVAYTQRQ